MTAGRGGPSAEALERLAAAAWPAERTQERDGWLLRDTPGLRGRARSNAALPLCPDADPAVALAWAQACGQPAARVSIAPAAARTALDARLAAAGWTTELPTDVLAKPLAPPARLPAAPGVLLLASAADSAWLAAWAEAEGREDAAAHARTVFAALAGRAAFVRAPGGEAVGLGVRSGDGVGLFCLATRSADRGAGWGRSVVAAIEAWAARGGARTAWLQVLVGNATAQRLYARAGYARSHGYHYRVLTRRPATRS